MPSWWGKSSSKESKKKTPKESLIDTLHRKFKVPSESKAPTRRHSNNSSSEKGSLSSPLKLVERCQSFNERPRSQPLPLPNLHQSSIITRTDSSLSASVNKPKVQKVEKVEKVEKVSKSSGFLPLPRPSCIRRRTDPADLDVESAVPSISSECSIESDDPSDFELMKLAPVSNNRNVKSSSYSKRKPLASHVPNLQVPQNSAFFSAPDSSLSSPSRSPLRGFEHLSILGSGQCSSPGSGQNSGHNSTGGDTSGHLFWQLPSRGSPEYSPIPSPRMTSPGPSSRIHSGAVTPLHPRAGSGGPDSQTGWPEDGKQQSHRLPLPPITVSKSSPFSHSNSAVTSPTIPRSPARAENVTSPGSRWKKGKLLGRGTFGHVYVGFNSESGEMCAMKEVTLFADDPKSKESAKQLTQEIAMLSRLRHPNIVQYYGCEMVGDKLYIYLEYVSGGSIYKLLQDYGEFGESAIRSYTRQILSGLAFLHAKNTVHRDIKGANILVDPNGRVKLADFGMAKHITGQTVPLSFKGSPYWMAPEVIKNSSGCNLAVDVWSLGCTVLEMATSKPPWSQYEGVAAMFKIGNSKELPVIPNHLSSEGKDFVKLCLQRDPHNRPTAAKLLDHPFVKNAATIEKPIKNAVKSRGIAHTRSGPPLESETLSIHSSRASKTNSHPSNILIPRNNISCPVSPIGSPLLNQRSYHLNGKMSPSPISSPRATSGSSTPLTGGFYLQEGYGNMVKPNNNLGPSYWGADSFRGGKQFQMYDGQSVLADRVSQQLLKDPSLDLSPSPLVQEYRNIRG